MLHYLKLHQLITVYWNNNLNILPTRANLQQKQKKVKIESKCELCDHPSETTCHILWECPFVRNVWAIVRGELQKCPNTTLDVFLLFCSLMSKLDIKELEVWAILAWAIWNARNKFYFERVQPKPEVILENAMGLLAEYQRLTAAQQHT